MIGSAKMTQQVSDEERERLKVEIEKVGRQEFAEFIGDLYYSMSHRLNGHQRLTVVTAYYYSGKLTEYKKSQKKGKKDAK